MEEKNLEPSIFVDKLTVDDAESKTSRNRKKRKKIVTHNENDDIVKIMNIIEEPKKLEAINIEEPIK